MLGSWVHVCNSSSGEAEIDMSLDAGQLFAELSSSKISEVPSQNIKWRVMEEET